MKRQVSREQCAKPPSFFDSDRNTIALILLHGIASGRNGAAIGTPESAADSAFRFADAILARANASANLTKSESPRTKNGADSADKPPSFLS